MGEPKITRALTARRCHTAQQRRLADRNLVIAAAWLHGLSIRLIASGLGLDPARIRQVLEEKRLWDVEYSPPPAAAPDVENPLGPAVPIGESSPPAAGRLLT